MSKKSRFSSSTRGFSRKSAGAIPPKSILIVTEGKNTEKIYFEQLAKLWNLHPKVIEIKAGGEGIPGNLAEKAREIRDKRIKDKRFGKLAIDEVPFDEVWIVFDTDHAQRSGKLHTGKETAKRYSIKTAHSTPCFEYWLSLHFALKARPMNNSEKAENLVKEVAGLQTYSKDKAFTTMLVKKAMPHVTQAVKNAQELSSQQSHDNFPPNPSTTVQDLVISLHETLPDKMRELYPLL
jgi:hypothetical protein